MITNNISYAYYYKHKHKPEWDIIIVFGFQALNTTTSIVHYYDYQLLRYQDTMINDVDYKQELQSFSP